MKTSSQIVEEWLVINCQAGDRRALELLVKRWNSKMLARVYYTTKNAAVSQDIVQDAWIIIIKKIKGLKDPSAFQSWSLKIATTLSIDWIRANQVHRKREAIRETVQAEFAEESVYPEKETIQYLKKAIERMPEEQRTVIHMFYQESLPIHTIGEILNLPEGTVKSRLFRGREYLKKMLENKLYKNENE